MSLEFYLIYVFACFIVVIVPGPTVTLIVANSMTYGARAGLTAAPAPGVAAVRGLPDRRRHLARLGAGEMKLQPPRPCG